MIEWNGAAPTTPFPPIVTFSREFSLRRPRRPQHLLRPLQGERRSGRIRSRRLDQDDVQPGPLGGDGVLTAHAEDDAAGETGADRHGQAHAQWHARRFEACLGSCASVFVRAHLTEMQASRA
jgi:hypothetical protein